MTGTFTIKQAGVLTAKQISLLLGVTQQTVSYLIKTEKLQASRFGRSLAVQIDDLYAYLDAEIATRSMEIEELEAIKKRAITI